MNTTDFGVGLGIAGLILTVVGVVQTVSASRTAGQLESELGRLRDIVRDLAVPIAQVRETGVRIDEAMKRLETQITSVLEPAIRQIMSQQHFLVMARIHGTGEQGPAEQKEPPAPAMPPDVAGADSRSSP